MTREQLEKVYEIYEANEMVKHTAENMLSLGYSFTDIINQIAEAFNIV